MTMTFYLWYRSLQIEDSKSYIFGALAGFAYFYMVASWGGYFFILNMVGAHAAFLILFGCFSDKVYTSYTLFYVVGTVLVIRISIVGLTPLKNLEQLAPLCCVPWILSLSFR